MITHKCRGVTLVEVVSGLISVSILGLIVYGAIKVVPVLWAILQKAAE